MLSILRIATSWVYLNFVVFAGGFLIPTVPTSVSWLSYFSNCYYQYNLMLQTLFYQIPEWRYVRAQVAPPPAGPDVTRLRAALRMRQTRTLTTNASSTERGAHSVVHAQERCDSPVRRTNVDRPDPTGSTRASLFSSVLGVHATHIQNERNCLAPCFSQSPLPTSGKRNGSMFNCFFCFPC